MQAFTGMGTPLWSASWPAPLACAPVLHKQPDSRQVMIAVYEDGSIIARDALWGIVITGEYLPGDKPPEGLSVISHDISFTPRLLAWTDQALYALDHAFHPLWTFPVGCASRPATAYSTSVTQWVLLAPGTDGALRALDSGGHALWTLSGSGKPVTWVSGGPDMIIAGRERAMLVGIALP